MRSQTSTKSQGITSGWLRSLPLAYISSLALLLPLAGAQNLTEAQIDVVSARLAEGAQQSWELGTRAQTILELNATTYSVFNSDQSLPPPSSIPSELSGSSGPLAPFFNISKTIVQKRGNGTGPQPLIQDGSAADPASIGVSVLIANLTGQDGGQVDYDNAAKSQVAYLYSAVPRTSDGALSHRVSSLQLWSDFVYMVPPFLAYYGVTTRNRSMVAESYNQIKLYRNYLRDSNQGMWRHVLLGPSGNDEGFWSTGNGWAAAGILRVLATIRQSEYANTFKNEQSDLGNWVHEIHAGIYPHLDNTNVFTNYADQPASGQGNFYDGASTALLASTVYRASLMLGQNTYLPFAERSRKTLSSSSSPAANGTGSFSGYQHFTSDGWLTPVVNPHSYGEQGSQSPEAQAFVVQMHASWRDWVENGSKGANGARSVRMPGGDALKWMVGVVVGGVLLRLVL